MKHLLIYFVLGLFCWSLSSCSKGYEVNFTNYYTEAIDSVIVGNNLLVFTNIETEASTDYKKIQKGDHSVKCISNSKKVFYSTLHIAGSGSGRRNIQIDGITQISITED
jgi:hypothetical protein